MAGILDRVFERFTDQARSVLTLAQEEARLLNHDFIGTEHILLGLVRAGEGVGGKALTSLGISLDSVRNEVQRTVGAASSTPRESPPFTPRAKKVLELSLREAHQLGHNYIGTEHILLGVSREGEGVAVRVLANLGVDLDSVRQRVIQLMSEREGKERGESSPRGGPIVSTFGDPATARPEPHCPQCRASLAEAVRFRTVMVPPDTAEDARDPIPAHVVYCSHCGSSLHMFKSDPPDR